MSGLPGPLVAMSVNWIGVRRTLVIGSLFIMTGAAMLATVVTNVVLAGIAYGLIVGTGVATGAMIAAQAGVAQWFVRRRALALSLLYSGGAIGGFVAPPVLSAIASSGDGRWRLGWWLIFVLSGIAALLALASVREKPADPGRRPTADTHGPTVLLVTGGARIPLVRHARGMDLTARRGKVRLSLDDALSVRRRERRRRDVPRAWHRAPEGSRSLDAGQRLGVQHDADQRSRRQSDCSPCSGDRVDPRYFWALFCATCGVGMILLVNAVSDGAATASAICIGIGFGGGIVAMMATLEQLLRHASVRARSRGSRSRSTPA